MPYTELSAAEQIVADNIKNTLVNWPTTVRSNTSAKAVNAECLAPVAQKVVDTLNAIVMPKNLIPAEVRAFRKENGNPFDLLPNREIDVEAIDIPLEKRILPARLYRPEAESTACLVYYHGGGFVLGDLDGYENIMTLLAKMSGINIISVAYRLAPETPFPGAVNDTLESFSWVYENAEKWGFDQSRIAIGGDSAGGNLATVACRLLRDQNRPQPAMQLLIYPSIIGNENSKSRETFKEGLFLTKESIKWFHDHYIDREDQDDPRFNILKSDDLSNLPPAFVATAGFDPLRDEGLRYTNTLREQGVTATHCCYTDLFHSFLNFGVIPEAELAMNDFAQLLKNALTTD